MKLSTRGSVGSARAAGPISWWHGAVAMPGVRRADLVVAAATRRRRSDGGDDPGGSSAAGADGGADHAADKPQRTRRRRATQPQESETAATELRDGKDLAALFAEALAPTTSGDLLATAAQKQPVKRVVRKRKAVGTGAALPRSDPWATYTGLFEVAALQQARRQEARQQKKQSQPQQQQQQQQSLQPQQQQQQQQPHAKQQQKQQEAKGEQQQRQEAKGKQQPSPVPRRDIPGARRVGGLFVQRLPTGVPLVPTTRVPAAEPLSSAQAAAQQLAKGLLGGISQSSAALSAHIVYVPHAPSPPSLVQGEESGSSRWDARSEALRRMRMRTIRQYGETLAGALEWPVDGRQLLFAAPTHLPVAVQRNWASIDVDDGPELTSLLPALSREVQLALGVALPERALRGERGAVLATAKPRAVAATLQEWVSVCGADYVRQLLEVEPCILVLPPSALLETLEALNRHLGLEPSDAVAFVLRHPALMGLRPDELEQQMEALGAAVGLTPTETRELALERPDLLLYTEVELTLRMQALQRLLPGATSKLPAMVARRPTLLLRSPRALARDIRQLANTLGLTDWAAARLVVGGPAILELSLATLARRLDRLKGLCSSHPKWQQQLTAMSPGGLGRCLRCSDATFDRLALLLDAGLAGSPRLPKVKRILTLPAGWFDEAYESLKAGRSAALASKSRSDAGAGGGEDSDDEDDSGLLWPAEEGPHSGGSSGRRGAGASGSASSEPSASAAAADSVGAISTAAGKGLGSSSSSGSSANGADVASPTLSAAAV